jgi:tripartite-type tricarboxylate transporter receptor subunit TctC
MGRRALLALAALALLTGAPEAAAQEAYPVPGRVIRFIVPYSPGTGADILARLAGPKLAERWKVAVVTDNRAGASGNIGAELVANAPPDGYTLLFTATAFGTNPALNRRLPFHPVNSFAPVALVATSAMSVLVASPVPARSLTEFIEVARRQPGALNYSSPGNGTPQHLAMELLKLETAIDLVHVPHRSSGSAMADVAGAHVQAMISSPQTAGPFVQGGSLRMLVILGSERVAAFPDVPTIREAGFSGLEVETWYGVLAPAGTNPTVVAALNAEINAIGRDAEFRDALAKQGMTPAAAPPARLGELIKNELARWTRVVDSAGIKAD